MDTGLLDELVDGLFDDAGMLADPGSDPAAIVARHHRFRAAHPAWLNSLLVTDRDAGRLDGITAEVDDSVQLPVTMINTTGAGGLTSIAERRFGHLRVVAVDSALRDPGDLIGNLRRVSSAARLLDPEITVRVQIPYGPGWQEAIAEADAEGLQGHIDCRDGDRLTEVLSAHIEADLSFAADLTGSSVTAADLINRVDALIDGYDPDQQASMLGSFDAARVDRIRRRLSRLRCPDVAGVVDELATSS